MLVKEKSERLFSQELEASNPQQMIMTGLVVVCIFGMSPDRAEKYGEELSSRRKNLEVPFVVGAVIHLGYCFDLLESHSLQVIQNYYLSLKNAYLKSGLEMPINKNIGTNTDKLLRRLDCAVFEYMHSEIKKTKAKPFDSIRAAFWEGKELYPSAGFKEKNHIQICIRNPNCIKGYFRPLEMDTSHPRV